MATVRRNVSSMCRSAGRQAIAGIALVVFALGVPAQDRAYPSSTIKVIVPFPAGGGTDVAARMYTKWLGELLGQPLVVENKAGATGAIGTVAVIQSKPDGYTLLIGSDSSTLLGPLFVTPKTFDPLKDLMPVALTVVNPMVMVVHPSVKANTVPEFVEEAKRRQLFYASIGEGSLFHFAGELFNKMTGTKLQHVPYKGAAPALADVRGGHAQVMFLTVGLAMPFIQDGSLKALAVLGDKRSDFLPGVPTLQESGLAGYNIDSWGGLFAPAGTPQAVIDRLADAVRKLIADPKFREEVRKAGSEVPGLSPSQVAALLAKQQASYAKLYDEIGMGAKANN